MYMYRYQQNFIWNEAAFDSLRSSLLHIIFYTESKSDWNFILLNSFPVNTPFMFISPIVLLTY